MWKYNMCVGILPPSESRVFKGSLYSLACAGEDNVGVRVAECRQNHTSFSVNDFICLIFRLCYRTDVMCRISYAMPSDRLSVIPTDFQDGIFFSVLRTGSTCQVNSASGRASAEILTSEPTAMCCICVSL